MQLPASDRLETLLQQRVAERDYVAYLVQYAPATGLALVNPRPGQTTGVRVAVTATLATLATLLVPGVRVHVRRIGNYPPVVTEVVEAALTSTARVEVVDPRTLAVSRSPNETSLHLFGWPGAEAVDVTFYHTNGLQIQTTFGSTLFISTEDDGAGRATFGGLFVGLPVGTPIGVRAVGEVSKLFAATAFSFR